MVAALTGAGRTIAGERCFLCLVIFFEGRDEEDFDRKRDPNYIDDDDLVDYCDEWFHEIIDDLKAQGDEKSNSRSVKN